MYGKATIAGVRTRPLRLWLDLLDKRRDVVPDQDDKPVGLTISGIATLLVGAATLLSTLSDWADRFFLHLVGVWDLVSKVVAHLLAIVLALRIITKTKLVSSGLHYEIPQYSYVTSPDSMSTVP